MKMITKEDLIRQAGAVAPELMQKTAAILTHLEQRDPDTAAVVAREIGEVAGYTYEKLASYGAVARWGAMVGGGIASGVLSNMAGDLYATAKRGLSRQSNFNSILKANPDLKQFDKKRLQDSFDAIHRYAPEMTADPLVGGSLLKSVADNPGNEAVAIKEIITTQKNLQKNEFRLGPGFELPEDARALSNRPKPFEVARDAKLRGRSEALKSSIMGIPKSVQGPDREREIRKALRRFDKQVDSTTK